MRERVDFESACLIHHRVVGEQDAVVTVFSRRYGRLSLWVQGKLSQPGSIPLFKPMLISWRSKGSSHQLIKLEVDSAYPTLLKAELTSEYLFSAFYVNELIQHFLPELADSSSLYDDYLWYLESMAQRVFIEPVLRIFERQLLISSGWLNDLSVDLLTGEAIRADAYYIAVNHEHYGVGVTLLRAEPQTYHSAQVSNEIEATKTSQACRILGATLIAFNSNNLSNQVSLNEVKGLMRWFIRCLLNGKPLKSRSLFKSFKLTL
ncbi:DNA repair protein RecO [Litoribrevibacter albus]|uniref:DNA repair protein RecO n=1 Tax=Litoribrevibacter albus TaxID=1473156 RepID=A0AA37S9U9_9GAMM|nr:DNA repair protein RecO [Litoribrevibacter albus]GLQ31201.1 DNA repair protein RecO [Litoribrevibacter albus]